MAEQDFVLLDHPKQDTGKAVKPIAATAVRSRLDWLYRILYKKNLQERKHKNSVRELDRVPPLYRATRQMRWQMPLSKWDHAVIRWIYKKTSSKSPAHETFKEQPPG